MNRPGQKCQCLAVRCDSAISSMASWHFGEDAGRGGKHRSRNCIGTPFRGLGRGSSVRQRRGQMRWQSQARSSTFISRSPRFCSRQRITSCHSAARASASIAIERLLGGEVEGGAVRRPGEGVYVELLAVEREGLAAGRGDDPDAFRLCRVGPWFRIGTRRHRPAASDRKGMRSTCRPDSISPSSSLAECVRERNPERAFQTQRSCR